MTRLARASSLAVRLRRVDALAAPSSGGAQTVEVRRPEEAGSGGPWARGWIQDTALPTPSPRTGAGRSPHHATRLQAAVQRRIKPSDREPVFPTTDPRRAGKIEMRHRGERTREWYFDLDGRPSPLHRNFNPLWQAHAVEEDGRLARVADRADVSQDLELRQALFDDKLTQLEAIARACSHARFAGHMDRLPRLEQAFLEAYDLLARLARGAQSEAGARFSIPLDLQLGVLKPAEPGGDQWFVDPISGPLALHLPPEWKHLRVEASGSIRSLDGEDSSRDVRRRMRLFTTTVRQYEMLLLCLDSERLPPNVRRRLEKSATQHLTALQRLASAKDTRIERDWSRAVVAYLFELEHRSARRRASYPRAINALEAKASILTSEGKDTSELERRMRALSLAHEAERIRGQPRTPPAELFEQVNRILGLPESPFLPSEKVPARAPTRAGVESAYEAYLQSFQTGVRSREHMATLEAALADPDVQVLSRTCTSQTGNGVEFLELSNGLRVVFKPRSAERLQSGRGLIEPGTQIARERAAYLVDKYMGHHAGAPPTVRRCIEGRLGSVQLFVPARSASELGMEKQDSYGERVTTLDRHIAAAALRPVALFDQVIGNLDRHGGNFLLLPAEAPAAIVPIDHGLCLPLANVAHDSTSVLDERHRLTSADTEALDELVAHRADLLMELQELDLHPRALLSMFERIAELRFRRETARNWSRRGARGA